MARQSALDDRFDVEVANLVAPNEELEHVVRRRGQEVGREQRQQRGDVPIDSRIGLGRVELALEARAPRPEKATRERAEARIARAQF